MSDIPMKRAYILDACCGPRSMWFEKRHTGTVYSDTRRVEEVVWQRGEDSRKLIVNPDIIADFRELPFADGEFRLVVFDPPHLVRPAGHAPGWLGKRYGVLSRDTWQVDLRQGFSECLRVLSADGFLVFKWSESSVKLPDVMELCSGRPLFGSRAGNSFWVLIEKAGSE